MKATAFQRAVWSAVAAIPNGEIRSYKEIAEAAGYPGNAINGGFAICWDSGREGVVG